MIPRWNPERKAWVFVARSVRTPAMTTKQKRRKRERLIAIYGRHCWLCDKPISDDPTIDHIVPRTLGGTNNLSNLRLAHARCNHQRGNGPVPVLLLRNEMRALTSDEAPL